MLCHPSEVLGPGALEKKKKTLVMIFLEAKLSFPAEPLPGIHGPLAMQIQVASYRINKKAREKQAPPLRTPEQNPPRVIGSLDENASYLKVCLSVSYAMLLLLSV